MIDKDAVTSAEMPIRVIDLVQERGREMRVIPPSCPSVHANLAIANMDFHEFADSADPDGVFRDF